MPTLNTLHRHVRGIAVLAILIAIATWALDLSGAVYTCPYCRVQRSTIGLLGLLMLLPDLRHWLVRWLAAVLATLGAVVAAMQHFNHWKRISAGEFRLAEAWYVDPFLLSGAALGIIVGLLLLIYSWPGRGADR
ncbi:hypothetical protein [Luteimonas huabeiensis]|uniref:hypothetical protein n=1 Tax=Luteimonas huabeiensis TaxID=1244513 RepID=UPI00046566D9|nr:hypothetical protein [Luteimonas huabeiensis]